MKNGKTKRVECLEMMQDKLYYYTQSHGYLSKDNCYICPFGLDDGTVLVAIWQTPDEKTKLHYIIYNVVEKQIVLLKTSLKAKCTTKTNFDVDEVKL